MSLREYCWWSQHSWSFVHCAAIASTLEAGADRAKAVYPWWTCAQDRWGMLRNPIRRLLCFAIVDSRNKFPKTTCSNATHNRQLLEEVLHCLWCWEEAPLICSKHVQAAVQRRKERSSETKVTIWRWLTFGVHDYITLQWFANDIFRSHSVNISFVWKWGIGFGRAKHKPASFDVEGDHWWLAAAWPLQLHLPQPDEILEKHVGLVSLQEEELAQAGSSY